MRATVAVALFLLLCPSISLADRYRDGYRSQPYYYGHRDSNYSRHHSGHGDDWIVPLAIVGGVLGVVALSQMNEPAPPPPPAPLCRDTYNHYDEYGNYLYSRYVDRPCY